MAAAAEKKYWAAPIRTKYIHLLLSGSADGSERVTCCSTATCARQEAHLLRVGVPPSALERPQAPVLSPHQFKAGGADARQQRQPHLEQQAGWSKGEASHHHGSSTTTGR